MILYNNICLPFWFRVWNCHILSSLWCSSNVHHSTFFMSNTKIIFIACNAIKYTLCIRVSSTIKNNNYHLTLTFILCSRARHMSSPRNMSFINLIFDIISLPKKLWIKLMKQFCISPNHIKWCIFARIFISILDMIFNQCVNATKSCEKWRSSNDDWFLISKSSNV